MTRGFMFTLPVNKCIDHLLPLDTCFAEFHEMGEDLNF